MDLNNRKKMNFLIVAESSFDDGLAFRCGLKNEHQRNYKSKVTPLQAWLWPRGG
jgi:hypothetical protein